MAPAGAVLGIVLSFFILNAIQETSSRLLWSFARDNGMVFSQKFGEINPRFDVPVNALLLSWFILVIWGCIHLASSTGKNADKDSATVFANPETHPSVP